MLFCNNLNQNGSHEQKLKYLPDACSGKLIGGMCMSEPEAGTDVLNMSTVASQSADKSYFTLTGTKMWITNGTLDGTDTGDVFFVYAKTSPGRKVSDMSAFIVEKGMPGFSLGTKITGKLGCRASNTAELVFDNVKVPTTNLIGKIGGAGICMMRNLEIERIAAAAMSIGSTRQCIRIMTKYATERKAFGKSIGDYGQIQKAIAESYAEYMAGRTYCYDIARRLDLSSFGNGLDADSVKLFAAPIAKRVADRAIQILGGNGYTAEYQVEYPLLTLPFLFTC
jgi:isovaleryl-CoA dehydrogenase